ncbi:MAG: protease modulator HflC [Planctomycetota bacterium]
MTTNHGGHSHAHASGATADGGSNKFGLRVAVGLATLLVLVLYSAIVSVRERHTTLVTRFGRLVRTLDEPGMHWKLPWPIEAEVEIDRRLEIGDTRNSEVLTHDRRNVVLESYFAWRVADPELFHRSLGGRARAEEVLSGLVFSAKRSSVSGYDLSALVSTNSADLRTDEIEDEIEATVAPKALSDYGIEVESVGLKRLSFPEENIEPVFQAMRAERQGVAKTERANGEAEGKKIRDDADVVVAGMISDAWTEARTIRGRADTEIAQRLGELDDLDQDLFAFLIQLDSLEQLITRDTAIYLDTSHGPFRLLNEDPTSPAEKDE